MADFDARNAFDDLRKDLSKVQTELAVMTKQVSEFEKALLERVQQLEFKPVKVIAYGLVGGVLTTVLGAILKMVIMK